MKYKLPRQIISQEIRKIISREMRKQKEKPLRASKQDMKEILAVSESIRKTGLPKHLVCKKLEHNLGRGIFLRPDAEPILQGQVIGPYAGVISIIPQNKLDDGSYAFTPVENMHLTKEEQAVFDKNSPFSPRRLYLMKVDALKKGNFVRFINHSSKPNVIAHTMYIPKNDLGLEPSPVEIIYIAKKTIYPGQQLLVSYEEGEDNCYWNALDLKPFPMTPKTFQVNSSLKVVTVQA